MVVTGANGPCSTASEGREGRTGVASRARVLVAPETLFACAVRCQSADPTATVADALLPSVHSCRVTRRGIFAGWGLLRQRIA